MKEFDEVVEDPELMETMGALGISCHHDDNDTHAHDEDTHAHNDTMDDDMKNDTSCLVVYNVCRRLILGAQLTTEACLVGNISSLEGDDDHDHDGEGGDDDDEVSDGEG